jgi:hypothetical protein
MMGWQAAVALGAVLAFFGLRLTLRRWIIDRWIDGALSNRRTGVLLGLIYAAPMLLLVGSAVIAAPESFGVASAAVALFIVPLVGLLGGLLDYATVHGVKAQIMRNREAARGGSNR